VGDIWKYIMDIGSPTYVLKTRSSKHRISQFVLKQLGLSCEYQIDITLHNPQGHITLSEPAC
jgi:hypothetical protein